MNTVNCISPNQSIVLYDANIYIALKNNGNQQKHIFDQEKSKFIKPYASPWVVLELMQHKNNDDALDVLIRHCACNLIADPIAWLYYIMTRKTSKTLQERLDQICRSLNSPMTVETKNSIYLSLLSASDNFANSFPTKVNVDILKDERLIKRRSAEDLVEECMKIIRLEQPQWIEDKEFAIEVVLKEFDGALTYYVDLLKRKSTQNQINKDSLRRDQRDWTLMFYSGRPNVYIVTNERFLLTLNISNVLDLNTYCQILDKE